MSGQEVSFTFGSYGDPERQHLAAALRRLTPKGDARTLDECGIALPMEEMWRRGSLHDVLQGIDKATRNTAGIGRRFLERSPGSKKRRAFHWRVGHPHPAATCALDIALVLESLNPVVGRLLLTQQVLRLGEDDFAYWGVD